MLFIVKARVDGHPEVHIVRQDGRAGVSRII